MVKASVSQSVERTFDILSLFEEERRPLGRVLIAEKLDAPRSSVAALLNGMTELGILSFDYSTQTYFPTERIGRMTGWILDVFSIAEPILDVMKQLQQRTKETVTLVTPLQQAMEVIRYEPGLHAVSYVSNVGQILPLWGSAVGNAYLSTQSDKTINDLFRKARDQSGKWTPPASVDPVMEDVTKVRENGFSIAVGKVASDAASIAMPLPPAICGSKSLVMALSGPSQRITENQQELVKALQIETAELIKPARKHARAA